MSAETRKAPGDNLFHVAHDEEYLRQLKAEEEFWDTTPVHIVDGDRPLPREAARYSNQRLTGEPNTEWFETISRYGTFTRGLCLGTGNVQEEAAILRSNPSLHLTFIDISGKALARREEQLVPAFPGRVGTRQMDLNFIELEKDAFDLVISDSTMHHLLNLEHVAHQINESLASGGYFFYHDYVGEARFQFSQEKKRFFEAAFAAAQQRYPFLRSCHIAWPKSDDPSHSPWEAIRSDDTLSIFREHLQELSLRTTWPVATLWLFIRRKPGLAEVRGWSDRFRCAVKKRLTNQQGIGAGLLPIQGALLRRRLMAEMLKLDREASEAGRLRPSRAFAIYRKRLVDATGGR